MLLNKYILQNKEPLYTVAYNAARAPTAGRGEQSEYNTPYAVVGGAVATSTGRPDRTYGMLTGRITQSMSIVISLPTIVAVTVFKKSMSLEEYPPLGGTNPNVT